MRQIIKFASEKVVQVTSEKYIKEHKNLKDVNANIDYISNYLSDTNDTTKTFKDFKFSEALKPENETTELVLKGGVSKDVYGDDLERIFNKKVHQNQEKYEIFNYDEDLVQYDLRGNDYYKKKLEY